MFFAVGPGVHFDLSAVCVVASALTGPPGLHSVKQQNWTNLTVELSGNLNVVPGG